MNRLAVKKKGKQKHNCSKRRRCTGVSHESPTLTIYLNFSGSSA